MPRYNPSSSIRGGFDYQDLWALNLCADLIEDPDRFKSIRFESAPDEIDDNKFFLDDIILLDADSRYHLYQVKAHSSAWSWDELLEQKKDKRSDGNNRPSLLMKWFHSAFRPELRGSVVTAVFITDAPADNDFISALNDGRVNLDVLRHHNSLTYDLVVNQLGDESNARAFFGLFSFRFGCPKLFDMESEVKSRFLRRLAATDSGFNSLHLRVKKESRNAVTQQWFTADDLRASCEFNIPRALSQDFAIPSDFQLFDNARHRVLIRQLRDASGGVRIITGKPGSGKSTYVAKLNKSLQSADVSVFRHHFFLSTDDPESSLRLTSGGAIEALKAQFAERPELFGDLVKKNSANVSLREYLNEAANRSFVDGKAFVLIVDGLDHVARTGDEAELKAFLSELTALQKGYWLILVMQEIAESSLPGLVVQASPKTTWIEIPGIPESAVAKLIAKNQTGLTLPREHEQLQAISHTLFSITDGNPLHLRYSLQSLKNRVGSTPIFAWDCNQLLPFEGGIAKYYSSLWNQIPSTAKTLLLAIAILKVRLSENELHSLVGALAGRPNDISDSYSQSRHLLRINRTGISIYHNSFEVFLATTPQYTEQREKISRVARNWASQSASDDLKWFLVPLLGYEIGEPAEVLNLDRPWLAQALAQGRPTNDITMLLRLGTDAAIKHADFARGLTLTGLASYHENALQFLDTDAERLWSEALWGGAINIERLDIASLQALQLDHLTHYADQRGLLSSIYQDLVKRLRELHLHLEVRPNDQFSSKPPQVPCTWLDVVIRDRNHEVDHISRYLLQFRDTGWSPQLLGQYATGLADTQQSGKLLELWSQPLSPDERSAVQDSLLRYDVTRTDRDIAERLLNSDLSATSPVAQLWKHLSGSHSECLPSLPSYDVFPTQVPEYGTDARAKEASAFSRGFILGILHALSGKKSAIEDWISKAEHRWSLDVMVAFLKAAVAISESIQSKRPIRIERIFAELSKVPPLKHPGDRKLYHLQIALRAAIQEILQAAVIIEKTLSSPALHDHELLLRDVPSQYFTQSDCLQFCLSQPEPWLTDESAQQLIDAEVRQLRERIDTSSDRTNHLLNLAQFARLHGFLDRCISLRRQVAENFLGYSYHKDMYLYDVMNMLRISHRSGSARGEAWIRRLAPIVAKVREFTDGDETSQFPEYLGDIMAEISPTLLRGYYYHAAQNEHLYLAQKLFASYLQTAPFRSAEEVALGSTAIDEAGLTMLRKLAQDSHGARECLRRIEAQFGSTQFPERSGTTPYTPTEHSLPQPQDVTPEALSSFVEHNWTYFLGREFLPSWCMYWVSKTNGRRRVFAALEELLELPKLRQSTSEILELLYPVALEFDPEAAFEYVCRAQAAGGGWRSHWADHEQSLKRWEFVKKYFSLRYIEFFTRSTASCTRDGQVLNTYVPLAMAAEFFALFDRGEIVEQLTESAVAFAESLVSELALPEPAWLSVPNLDPVDLLLQRLLWPSPLVRERAATQISELLMQSGNQSGVYQKLLDWIATQRLETTVAMGILPIVRAADIRHAAFALDLQSLCDAIPVTSVVIRKLIEELATLTANPLTLPDRPGVYWAPPETYSPSDFFQRYNEGLLPPIYRVRLGEIKCPDSHSAFTQWSFVCQRLAEECGIDESVGEIPSFAQDSRSWTAPGVAPLLSEVYRSAFLRVIASFHSRAIISDAEFRFWSYATCPIDLSFWKTSPSRPPAWWPATAESVQAVTPDAVIKFTIQPSPSCAIEQHDQLVLAFEGAVKVCHPGNRSARRHSCFSNCFWIRCQRTRSPITQRSPFILG